MYRVAWVFFGISSPLLPSNILASLVTNELECRRQTEGTRGEDEVEVEWTGISKTILLLLWIWNLWARDFIKLFSPLNFRAISARLRVPHRRRNLLTNILCVDKQRNCFVEIKYFLFLFSCFICSFVHWNFCYCLPPTLRLSWLKHLARGCVCLCVWMWVDPNPNKNKI